MRCGKACGTPAAVAGQTACFLKGLIKLAAAGVKVSEGIPQGVQNHALRAADLFRQIAEGAGGEDCRYLGLRSGDLIRFAEDIALSRISPEQRNRSMVQPVFASILSPA